MGERRVIGKATVVMALATGLSRIAGLVRDVVVGRLFGAGMVTDAFFVAFTIPNLLRRFFAEGSLTAAFVPVFSEVHHKQGAEEGRRVASMALTALVLVVGVVVALGILLSPWIVQGIGFGFGDTPGKLALTDTLNRIMFPYIFFVSVLALLTGVLNVYGHFFVPSLSPLFLNLSMIGSALLLGGWFSVPVYALAAGVVIGGFIQVCSLIPILRKYGISLKPRINLADPTLRRIMKLMLPGIAGVAIYQINVAVTRLLASFLDQGGVSFLYYGQRLFEFPQGVFIVSLAQALLPSMSRHAAEGDWEEFHASMRFALRLILLVTVPAALGLMLCAQPVFSLFFFGGAFDLTALQGSAEALAWYAPGLLFVGMSRIYAPTFYALKDTRTPVVISFWTLIINVVSGLVLMQYFGHIGLAAALTVSSIANAVLLRRALLRRIPVAGEGGLGTLALKILIPALVMGGVVLWILSTVSWIAPGDTLRKGIVLALAVSLGGAVYGAGCWMMGIHEIRDLGQMFLRKVRRR